MKAKAKTIDIVTLEWFDKVNGNSYFASIVTVNFGMKTAKVFKIPFQYGYGDYHIQAAKELLFKEGLINTKSSYELREQGIILRTVKHENCKKSELKNI